MRMVQVGDRTQGWAVPFGDWGGLVKEILDSYDRPIVMHNAKFDLHFLRHNQVNIGRHLIHDTRAMAHILHPNRPTSLKWLSTEYVHPNAAAGQHQLKQAMFKNRWDWATVPVDFREYWVYAALDPVLTVVLAETFYPMIDASFKEVYDLEISTLLALEEMEARGIAVDTELCQNMINKLAWYEHELRLWFSQIGVDNPGSDRQMIEFFQDQGIQLTQRTDKGNISLDARVLETIDHPVAAQLVNFRNAVKMRSTYWEDFLEFSHEGILHGNINPLGARTGRMSASRPNLQNVPRSKVRDAFVPREGNKLLLVDFDQIELRLMAHYANETGMLEAVLDGEDLHTYIGKMIYQKDSLTPQERQVTKAANFAKIYGAGAKKFGETAGISTLEAQQFMTMYDSRFPGVGKFVQQLTQDLRLSGGEIITPFVGRKQVAELDKAYKIVNYFIQGTAADVLKRAIQHISMTDSEQFMLIPIHDEIAFDVPEEFLPEVIEEVTLYMEDTVSFSIPLTVDHDVVSRWGEKY